MEQGKESGEGKESGNEDDYKKIKRIKLLQRT